MAKARAGKPRKRPEQTTPGTGWAAVALLVLSLALFANTLQHDFVFDDIPLIVQDPNISNLNWSHILSLNSYRPVRTLTYAINYAIGGEDPFSYHLFNVVLHGFTVVAAFFLLRRLTGSGFGAIAGALIFALHPAQTAAVAYVSGRKDALAAFFVFMSLIWFLKAREAETFRPALYLSTVGFAVLALLSKEVAVVLPALLVLSVVLVEARRWGTDVTLWGLKEKFGRVQILMVLSVTLLAAVMLVWSMTVIGASRMEGYWGGTLETNLGTGVKLFAHYARLAVVPYPLVADYVGEVFAVSTGFDEGSTLLALAFLGSYVAAAFWLVSRRCQISIGMLWFLLCLVPVLQLFPFHELAADHFLYLPLFGVSLVFAAMLDLLRRRAGAKAATGLLVIVSGVFALATVDRNRDWATAKSLWEATIQDAPNSYRASVGLGQIYFQEGRFQEALELTRKSVELEPSRPTAWNNLGVLYHRQGQFEKERGNLEEAERLEKEAIRHYEEVTELDPEDPFAYGNIGNCYRELGLIYDAYGQASKALQYRIAAADSYHKALQLGVRDRRKEVQAFQRSMAALFIDVEDWRRVRHYLTKYFQTYPNDPVANRWMGYSLRESGNYSEAIPYLRRSLEFERANINTWDWLADSLTRLRRYEEAIETYKNALPYAAKPSEVHYNLGVLYYDGLKEPQPALRHFQESIRIEPGGRYAARAFDYISKLREGEGSDSR